jgi:hypothetical protein
MKLRFIFDLSEAFQEEFLTTEDTEFHGEKMIFVLKLRVTQCNPWLFLTYWASHKERLV